MFDNCNILLGSSTNSSTVQSNALQPSTSTGSTPLSNSSTTLSAVNEHRRLFNFNKSRSYSKKNKATSKKKEKQPTCKLKFVCLATTTATAPPSSVKDKTDLCNAGLGDCTLHLDLNKSSVYLHEEIVKKFPQLADTGGYELLLYQRGGGCEWRLSRY
mgnify:CR=1 FL=1